MEFLPIVIETILAAIQLGTTNPKHALPLKPNVELTKVETDYVIKPLTVDTVMTKEDPPKRYLVSYKPPRSSVEKVYADNTNNCVNWAKQQTGIYRPMGLGGQSAIQGYEPRIGAIGVLPGHAVVVENIENGMVTFRESNYIKNFITRRTLPESSFRGYIYE